MSNGDLRTPWVVPQDYGALGDGSHNDAQAFQDAAATGKPILVPPATYLIADQLVLNSAIRFEPGAVLKLIFGPTVTFNGLLEAGPWRIFDTSQNPGVGGGFVLGPGAVERAFPEWWGAKGDGVAHDSDALEAAIGAVSANKTTIQFAPGATYLLSRTVRGAPNIRWSFNDTEFKASSTGTYDPVLGSGGAATGLDVFFSVDDGIGSIYEGLLIINGSFVPNLCGVSGHDSGNSISQYWEHVRISNCERAIFAVNQSNANTLVGHYFGIVDCFDNGYDLYVENIGVDDAVFGLFRSHGSPHSANAGKANIYLDNAWGVVIHSLYLRGERPDRDGIVLNSKSALICDHMFIEHDFDVPIRLQNADNTLRATIGVSTAFSSSNGAVIECLPNEFRCFADVMFTDRTIHSTGVTTLVRLSSAGGANNRVIRIRTPFGTSTKTPVTYTGGGSNHAELVEVIATNGVFRYYYDGATTTAERQDTFLATQAAATTLGSVSGRIEVFDSAGKSLGFVPIYDAIR